MPQSEDQKPQNSTTATDRRIWRPIAMTFAVVIAVETVGLVALALSLMLGALHV